MSLPQSATVIFSSRRSSPRASGFFSPTLPATRRPATISNLRQSFASSRSILRGFIDEKTLAKLTVKHPVSRYDLKYFPEFSAGGSSECEAEFESFDPDARRGARMLALRKKIGESAPDRTRREGDRLLDCLGGKLRERVERGSPVRRNLNQRLPRQTQRRTEELALPIAAIRRYLECPLQGAARYSLGMLEDEDAPEDAEDEPVEQSRLNRAVMLRKVFWRAGGKLDVIDEEYAREVRIAQARGYASAGQFAEAAKAADDSALRQWIAQASEAGVNDFDRLERHPDRARRRICRRRRDARAYLPEC